MIKLPKSEKIQSLPLIPWLVFQDELKSTQGIGTGTLSFKHNLLSEKCSITIFIWHVTHHAKFCSDDGDNNRGRSLYSDSSALLSLKASRLKFLNKAASSKLKKFISQSPPFHSDTNLGRTKPTTPENEILILRCGCPKVYQLVSKLTPYLPAINARMVVLAEGGRVSSVVKWYSAITR